MCFQNTKCPPTGAQDTHSRFKEERRERRKEWQSQPCGSTGGWSCPSKPRWRQPCARGQCTPWAQHGCCQGLLPVPRLHLPHLGQLRSTMPECRLQTHDARWCWWVPLSSGRCQEPLLLSPTLRQACDGSSTLDDLWISLEGKAS